MKCSFGFISLNFVLGLSLLLSCALAQISTASTTIDATKGTTINVTLGTTSIAINGTKEISNGIDWVKGPKVRDFDSFLWLNGEYRTGFQVYTHKVDNTTQSFVNYKVQFPSDSHYDERAGGRPYIWTSYKLDNVSSVLDNEVIHTLVFDGIIEYNETNNIPGYQYYGLGNASNDQVVDDKIGSFNSLKNFWNLFYLYKFDNETHYVINITSKDGANRPKITFTFNLVKSVIASSKSLAYFDPDQIKWSLDITNFPFKSNGTYLALKVFIKTQEKHLVEFKNKNTSLGADRNASQHDRFEISNNRISGAKQYYSWNDTYEVNGTLKSIIVHHNVNISKENFTDQKDYETGKVAGIIFYSFPDNGSIHWDPSNGVAETTLVTTDSSVGSTLSLSTLVAFLVALLGIFFSLAY